MGEIFVKAFNLSVTAGWIILGVVILRFIFKKAPKNTLCFLWAIAGARLVFPFSIESTLSLIPSRQTIDTERFVYRPYVETGVSPVDNRINDYLHGRYFEGVTVPTDNFADKTDILAVLWIVGIIALLVYGIVSFIKLKLHLKTATLLRDNIYESEYVKTPFVLGIIKPKIYLPYNLKGDSAEYIIRHERAHIERHDNIIKPLAFLITAAYWFNPLVWLAYFLLCRDIELACDERVIKNMDKDSRREYSSALVKNSVDLKRMTVSPVMFCTGDVKERVKSVMKYKKPSFWIAWSTVAVCIISAMCFLTYPSGIRINEIDDGGDVSGIFNNVSSIELVYNDTYSDAHTETIYDRKTVANIADSLQNIWLEKKPMSSSRSEHRDKTNTVVLHCNGDKEGTALCFDFTYTELWLNDGVKPSYTYKVRNPDVLKDLGLPYTAKDLRIDNKLWRLSRMQKTSDGSSIGGGTEMANIKLNAQNGVMTVLNGLNGKEWKINYSVNNEKPESVIYDIECNGQKGLATSAVTKYQSGNSNYTLIISLGEYNATFTYDYLGINNWLWYSNLKSDIYTYLPQNGGGDVHLELYRGMDSKFQFIIHELGVYFPEGTYKIKGDTLTLVTDDHEYKYVFKITQDDRGEVLVFDEEHSSELPDYRYYNNGKPLKPLPDGAEFVKVIRE